eukprot:20395-Rhodomonas_salina.1
MGHRHTATAPDMNRPRPPAADSSGRVGEERMEEEGGGRQKEGGEEGEAGNKAVEQVVAGRGAGAE